MAGSSNIPNFFIFYGTVIGSAFFLTSTIFLVNLIQAGLTPSSSSSSLEILEDNEKFMHNFLTPLALPLSMTESELNQKTSQKEKLEEWKFLAITGLVYGLVCFFASIIQLWSHRLSSNRKPKGHNKIHHSPKKMTMNGDEECRVENEKQGIKSRVVSESPSLKDKEKNAKNFVTSEEEWEEPSSSPLKRGLKVLIGSLWTTSILVPAYVAVNVNTKDAIRSENQKIRIAALALFVTCALSLVVVIVSAGIVIRIQSRQKPSTRGEHDAEE